MPEISVIVPVYNVEKYLPRCVDSILSQTFGDFELILVDDGSSVKNLRGVRIGKGSVIGAGAVVSKNVPPYSVYTGVPEVKIRRRFTDDQIKQHEKLLKENERDAIC